MSKEKILVVDDDDTIVRALVHALGEEGYEVHGASHGEEALGRLSTLGPDIVIANIKMPGMDGLMLLREIKKEIPGLPVIMMAGYANIDASVEAIKLGAYDYVTKPLHIDRFKLIIRQALDTAVLREEVKQLRSESATPLDLLISPGRANAKELSDLLCKISELYRTLGGSGVRFRVSDSKQPAHTEVLI